jgi:putative SOS response-associated peptidase YedK
MCGRYTLRRLDWHRRVEGLGPPPFEEFSELKIRFNVAPSQLIPIIVNDAGHMKVRGARWGFTPHWADASHKLKPINAKCETVATSSMFRDAFKRRRCLIPADGFYEWMGAKPPKIPHFIRMRDDSLFCFAGIREGDTTSILTTSPNELMSPIHNRMPVIIAPKDYARWLGDGDVSDLLCPFDAEKMEAYAISTRVNNVRNDAPDLIVPER